MQHLKSIILTILVARLGLVLAAPEEWFPQKDAPEGVDQAKFDDISYPYQDDIDMADPAEVFGEK